VIFGGCWGRLVVQRLTMFCASPPNEQAGLREAWVDSQKWTVGLAMMHVC
jgi:hypothetical protein